MKVNCITKDCLKWKTDQCFQLLFTCSLPIEGIINRFPQYTLLKGRKNLFDKTFTPFTILHNSIKLKIMNPIHINKLISCLTLLILSVLECHFRDKLYFTSTLFCIRNNSNAMKVCKYILNNLIKMSCQFCSYKKILHGVYSFDIRWIVGIINIKKQQ